ncbi:MAG TPA: hypothetical protein VFV64_13670, partial [Permianibacter sp.]|nr:hypothetical protein [Permianibacter sp.]
VVADLELHIPLAGLIDVEAEKTRLTKEISKLAAEVERLNGRLSNPAFADKAPTAIVQKERDKLAETQTALVKLQEQLKQFGG